MGAALLLEWAPSQRGKGDFDAVVAAMPRRIAGMTQKHHTAPGIRICVWTHDLARTPGLAADPATGSFLAVIGNPSVATGVPAEGDELLDGLLRACLADGTRAFAAVSPPFACVFYDGRQREAHVLIDRLGFQHLYMRIDNAPGAWVCSSGLALASALGSTVEARHVAEWLAMGHFMSDRTLVREVRKLNCGEHVHLTSGGAKSRGGWEPTSSHPDLEESDELVDRFGSEFRKSVVATAVGSGVATEMTGGIDSRYLLATLLDSGVSALAWTLGQPGWNELRTIERLREKRAFPHRLVALGANVVHRLPSLVEEMQELSDGEANALEYAPLLVAFDELATARKTSLSGVAGEIARGFYFGLLGASRQERGVPIEALLVKETRPAAPAKEAFARESGLDPTAELRSVIEDFVARSPADTPEGILEDLYLRARLQRFAGRNFTTTGYFCRQGLPYFGNEFVELVLRLPFQVKQDGWIIRKSLMRIAPDLAAVSLTAGMAVAPASALRPDRILRRYASLARRAAAKYGGKMGRRLAVTGPEMVPWTAVRADPMFGEWTRALLLDADAQSSSYLNRERVQAVIGNSLGGRSLYPLGLLLTLELTLRKLAGRGGVS
jgi:hypothetical protein